MENLSPILRDVNWKFTGKRFTRGANGREEQDVGAIYGLFTLVQVRFSWNLTQRFIILSNLNVTVNFRKVKVEVQGQNSRTEIFQLQ